MARSKPRYQWIDAISITPTVVAAGAVGNVDQVTEAELENLGGGGTLERIVGSIIMVAGSATQGRYTVGLMIQETYAGATLPSAAAWLTPDVYQRKDMLWSSIGVTTTGAVNNIAVPRVHNVDWRSRRKLGQGVKVTLSVSVLLQSVQFISHLRFLVRLP